MLKTVVTTKRGGKVLSCYEFVMMKRVREGVKYHKLKRYTSRQIMT